MIFQRQRNDESLIHGSRSTNMCNRERICEVKVDEDVAEGRNRVPVSPYHRFHFDAKEILTSIENAFSARASHALSSDSTTGIEMGSSKLLTRSIFRAITSNQPYVFAGCHRLRSEQHRPERRQWRPNAPQRRHIFGISFGATPRRLQDSKNTRGNLDLALSQLVDLMRARRSQSKPPPPEKVADALNYLFRTRLESPRFFTRNEIYLATESLRHLQELKEKTEDGSMILSEDDLHSALAALAAAVGRDRFRSDTQALAHMVFQELREMAGTDGLEKIAGASIPYLAIYIAVLARTGGARKAQDLLQMSTLGQSRESMRLHASVIEGLATEGLEKQALKMVEKMHQELGPLEPMTHEDLVVNFAGVDKIKLTKAVYELPLEKGSTPTTKSMVNMVRFCIRNNEPELGESVVKMLASDLQGVDAESTVLLWYAVKGMEMSQLHSVLGDPMTIDHLNSLLEYAYSTRNQEMSRALLSYMNTANLRPDAKTFALQLENHLHNGALQSAITTFDQLSSEDTLTDNSDIPALNALLSTLCFSPSPNHELIMRLVDRLLDRNADLTAEAIAGLCSHFLHRDDLQQIIGLLRHRVDSYPGPERARIASIFRAYIIDPKTDEQRAYNAYDLFRTAFPETPPSSRLPLMTSFFTRSRPDLACLVFGHMRQREDLPARPNSEAYAQCFEGIASTRDIDGLQIIYNMLKLDLEVEPCTRIHNALMAANTAVQLPYRSVIDHFWKIMDSREGPTMSSFALALRACETFVPQGAQEARRIVAMMQAGGLPITREIYHCYLGALAGNSEFENCVELVEEMEGDLGEKPDAITIGTFYNAIPWQYRKDEVERWARSAYPELWEELLGYGEDIDEEWEIRTFRIPRDIDGGDEPLFGEGEYSPLLAQETQFLIEESNHR